MNPKMPAKAQPVPAYLSAEWPPFEQNLVAVLAQLEEDQYLILSVKRSDRFVQFAGQGSFGMRAETTSNSYLPKSELLNGEQIEALQASGWLSPTGAPVEAIPERDPDGSPNFFRDFPQPVPYAAIARLTVSTFAEILRVPHPGFLEYEAFDDNGPLLFPSLGVKVRERKKVIETADSTRQRLLTVLREVTNLPDLEYDKDGDIAIRFGSALVYARVTEDPLLVRLYAPILSGIEVGEALLTRLNDINAHLDFTRFVYRNGAIFGLVDAPAIPFVADHVAQAFRQLCTVADGIDDLLQAEFGGQTAFLEPVTNAYKH
ncbi:T3SS (YopN, CesT) and YbjN peptide-binding chaperone 1 [Candidatus Methylocalor cossyra]|uniref:Uncharacterized protein n=1 Tax=Candidatus Methylocalor cossyra TaxID=3108543 RepID=A0ABM9NMR9_9GAMM